MSLQTTACACDTNIESAKGLPDRNGCPCGAACACYPLCDCPEGCTLWESEVFGVSFA